MWCCVISVKMEKNCTKINKTSVSCNRLSSGGHSVFSEVLRGNPKRKKSRNKFSDTVSATQSSVLQLLAGHELLMPGKLSGFAESDSNQRPDNHQNHDKTNPTLLYNSASLKLQCSDLMLQLQRWVTLTSYINWTNVNVHHSDCKEPSCLLVMMQEAAAAQDWGRRDRWPQEEGWATVSSILLNCIWIPNDAPLKYQRRHNRLNMEAGSGEKKRPTQPNKLEADPKASTSAAVKTVHHRESANQTQ